MSSKQKNISKKDISLLESIVDDAVEIIYNYNTTRKVDSNKFKYLTNRINREFNTNSRMVLR